MARAHVLCLLESQPESSDLFLHCTIAALRSDCNIKRPYVVAWHRHFDQTICMFGWAHFRCCFDKYYY